MSQINTSFPDSTYSSSNKPSVATLKADIQAVETAVNEIDTNVIRKDGTVAMAADWSMGSNKITNLKAPTAATDAASIGVCWPVGSVYTNKTVATNPAILFGIGTWVAIEGEVVVGYKSGDASFGTPGGAVGAKTVAIAQANLPNISTGNMSADHSHSGNTGGQSANHTHTGASEAGDLDGSGSNGAINGGGTTSAASNDHTHGFTTGGASANHSHSLGGSGTALSIIQPSRICYVWERTA